jgi:hypothetical protein
MSVLFYGSDEGSYFETVRESIKDEIEALPENQFLSSTEDEIIGYICSKYEIIPLEIYEDKMYAQHKNTKVAYRDYERHKEYDGLKFSVRLPFTGDQQLWYVTPSTWTTTYPEGSVQTDSEGRNVLVFDVAVGLQQDPDTHNKLIEDNLKSIKFYLAKQKTDVERFNKNIRNIVEECIRIRKSKLDKKTRIIRAFKIPLHKSDDAPDISLIPIKRKLIKPLPSPPGHPPEYEISKDDYEHILGVIRHEGRSFESTPRTFAVHDEEELRDIILAHLNGHYKGGATGETFRGSGKTDIRIESENRAAFVAECKVWRGPSELSDAIDQLLGYLTWRDCKTAIVIFNKEVAGFTEIQKKVHGIFKGHSNYERIIAVDEAGEWRFLFHSKEDSERKVIIHVFMFNLYVKK